jgi:hypothetical protein
MYGGLPMGVDRPGVRSKQCIGVGSANVRSLKGDNFKLACNGFVRRRFFICGVSEHWKSGCGITKDGATGFLLYILATPRRRTPPAGSAGWAF